MLILCHTLTGYFLNLKLKYFIFLTVFFPEALAKLAQLSLAEPQDAVAPRSNPSTGEIQLHRLTWADWGVSWINREGSAGWRKECQILTGRHGLLWSTAVPLWCWLLAPHLHSDGAVFAHSRPFQCWQHHVPCDWAVLSTVLLLRVAVWYAQPNFN